MTFSVINRKAVADALDNVFALSVDAVDKLSSDLHPTSDDEMAGTPARKSAKPLEVTPEKLPFSALQDTSWRCLLLSVWANVKHTDKAEEI